MADYASLIRPAHFVRLSPGDALRSLLMPSFVLGASAAAVLMRHTRAAMLATGMEHGMEASYVRLERMIGSVPLPESRTA